MHTRQHATFHSLEWKKTGNAEFITRGPKEPKPTSTSKVYKRNEDGSVVYKVTKNKLHNNKYIDRYMGDAVFKTTVVLYRSLGINLMYVVVNIISACVYETNWFGVFAVYYAL